MAIDLNDFKKKVEKRLPILFLVEENSESQVSAGLVVDVLKACLEKNIHTEFMLFSFGLEWSLKFPKLKNDAPYFANLEGIKIDDIRYIINDLKPSKQTFLGSTLEVSKAILDDPDTTKSDRYKPVVIIIASKIPAQGWEDCFQDLLNNGRSSNAQVYWLYRGSDIDDILKVVESVSSALSPFPRGTLGSLYKSMVFGSKTKVAKEMEPNNLKKRFEKVCFKNIGLRLLDDLAQEIVSSFKLEPLDEVPTEDPVEFTTPGFDGDFGDGADAKGDGVV